MPDDHLDAPAFHRNIGPILEVLTPIFGNRSGHALEIGCGSGQHATAFAEAFPSFTWWPSDIESSHRRSADAWREDSSLDNIGPAIALDATAGAWPLGESGYPPSSLDAIYAFNVIHISPWSVAEGIFAGAQRHLGPGGLLILYGPFKRDGLHTAESNAQFDASLRSQNADWGVRNLEDVDALAKASDLRRASIREMPANNLTLVFESQTGAAE